MLDPSVFKAYDVRGVYPVGSGDAFLGGLAVAFARGGSVVEAARLGMAAGIANAQLPGAGDGVTAGQAEFIEPMACAGVGAGVDGVFMEVHQDPPRAKSDAQNALKLDLLPALLDQLTQIHAVRTRIPTHQEPVWPPR